MHTIKVKIDFDNDTYFMLISKPKERDLTIHFANWLFWNQLESRDMKIKFMFSTSSPYDLIHTTKQDLEDRARIKVLAITKEAKDSKSLFKNF
jgi:hypothetical protein